MSLIGFITSAFVCCLFKSPVACQSRCQISNRFLFSSLYKRHIYMLSLWRPKGLHQREVYWSLSFTGRVLGATFCLTNSYTFIVSQMWDSVSCELSLGKCSWKVNVNRAVNTVPFERARIHLLFFLISIQDLKIMICVSDFKSEAKITSAKDASFWLKSLAKSVKSKFFFMLAYLKPIC